jgi:CcmD family protein
MNYTIILVAVLVVWAGVFAYLVALDRKVARAEKHRRAS